MMLILCLDGQTDQEPSPKKPKKNVVRIQIEDES